MMLARPVAMVIFDGQAGNTISTNLLAWCAVKLHLQEISERAIARAKLVHVSVARWDYCMSRCVRKAFLLGKGEGNRRHFSG
jgi:hypothetical protein